MASPNTTFVSGNILTAAQMNNLPFGVCNTQTITSIFNTSAPHTTFQDNGMTLTITEVSGRKYRITALGLPYPTGGAQGMGYRILRAGVSLVQRNLSTLLMNATNTFPLSLSYVYTAVSSGSVTYTAQIQASTNNTQVTDYADATFPRQFFIEDIGS